MLVASLTVPGDKSEVINSAASTLFLMDQPNLLPTTKKSVFVDQLRADTGKIVEIFSVAQCEQKSTKAGKVYLSMTLGDKTGTADAKMWDVPDGLTVSAGDFLKVEATTSEYRSALQLKVTRARVVDRSEVSPDEFIPTSKNDRDGMMKSVVELCTRIEHATLSRCVMHLIQKHRAALADCPAAKTLHQPYLGGLLEHIIGIATAAIKICEAYPQLNRDILIASAIVHDIGKIHELVWNTHIDYGRLGSLVGHVTLGAILFHEVSGDLDPVVRDHVMHIIASHHGNLEWGAAKLPQTKEAYIFHLLDAMDARIQVCENAVNDGVNANGFTPFNKAMGTALWDGAH